MMKLWYVSQDENVDYDTYDGFVVVAPDEETARDIHPNGHGLVDWEAVASQRYTSWATKRELVAVRYIGMAAKDLTKSGQIICSSYNAG